MNPQSFPPEPTLPVRLMGVEGQAAFDGHELTIQHRGARNIRRRHCDFACAPIGSILHVEVIDGKNGSTYLLVDVLTDAKGERNEKPERSPWTLRVEDRRTAEEFARRVNDRISGTRYALKNEPYRLPSWWQTPLLPVAALLLSTTVTLAGFTVWTADHPVQTVKTVKTVVRQCENENADTSRNTTTGQAGQRYYAPPQSGATENQDNQQEDTETAAPKTEKDAQKSENAAPQKKQTARTAPQTGTDTKKDNTSDTTQNTDEEQQESQDDTQQQTTPNN